MRYMIARPCMTIGKPGQVISRAETNMSDKGLARAVEVGMLLEIWEPSDDPPKRKRKPRVAKDG